MALRTLDVADGFASSSVPSDVALPVGASTEEKQDDILAKIEELLTELKAKADLSETQPVNIQNTSVAVTGPLTDVQLRATPVPVSGTLTTTFPAQSGSFNEDATLTTSVETITAPAGAFACFVEADDTNTTNIRVKMGGTATTSSGIQFQPGRSELYQGGSNISVCMESGTGKVSVQWFTR